MTRVRDILTAKTNVAGHHPWRELRDALATPETQAEPAPLLSRGPSPEETTPKDRAAAWLTHSLDVDDYTAARRAVREELGLDPDVVPHEPPPAVAKRLAAVRSAVGSVELEGLDVDPDTVTVLEGVARGELAFEAAREALLARIAAERRREHS